MTRRRRRHLRPLAQRSRAYTASKQRDFGTYAADLEALYRASPNADLRGDLLRALDRAGRHQDAIDLWLTPWPRSAAAAGTAALSQAIEQAMRGGLYSQARTLFERLPAKDRLRGDRPWIDAWLKLRLGERDAAIQAFAALERRRGEQAGGRPLLPRPPAARRPGGPRRGRRGAAGHRRRRPARLLRPDGPPAPARRRRGARAPTCPFAHVHRDR